MHPSEDTDDEKALEVIKTGLDTKSPQCGNFWEDFIRICNNDPEGLAELLDVPTYKIGNWGTKIHNLMKQVETSNKVEKNDKSNVIKTGDIE